MNAKTLAQQLQGCEYRNEVSSELEAIARKEGLVIVFCLSDDLMKFRGAIDDEVGCYGGGDAFVTESGLLKSECDEGDNCPHYQRETKKAVAVEALLDVNNNGEECWVIQTSVPSHPFEVLDKGELYCRGIVFFMGDVEPKSPSK